MTPADKQSLLDRACPGYRAAVTGRKDLPAKQTATGAVQFAAYAVSARREGDATILRAAIDEGQTIEVKLPAGVGVMLTSDSKRRAKAALHGVGGVMAWEAAQ